MRTRGNVSASPSASSSAASSSSSAAKSSSELAELIAKLRAEAGTANGTDRTDAQRQAVGDVLTRIEAFNEMDAPARADLTGTDWELLYTDSSGNSSGKIGPFVGRVTQARNTHSYVETDGARENIVYRCTAPRDDLRAGVGVGNVLFFFGFSDDL